MRDAVNLLERALVFGEKIEEDNVKNILGILPEEYLKSYLVAILNGDSDEIIALSENIERLGYSHDSVIRQSIELTKDMISRRELEFERGVKLIEKLWEVNREMRYSENKKLTFEVLSLTTLAAMNVPSVSVEPAKAVNAVVKEEVKKSNEEKEVEPITTDIDVSKKSEKVDSKFKEFFETIYEEGHVLIWVLLNLATIKEEDDVFALSFALNDLFARELAKEHIETISELMKMRLGKPAKINDNDIVESSDILKKLNPDEKAYVKRILTLFEGLDAKDVKIEIEEEGNG
jgi:DNA polymerase-3 subunit gamma/tau